MFSVAVSIFESIQKVRELKCLSENMKTAVAAAEAATTVVREK
jgi:hypothetical protein